MTAVVLQGTPAPQHGESLSQHEQLERDVPAAVRQQVLERDHYQCRSCGQAGDNRLQLHHVVFRSQGGGHAAFNLVTLCLDCHGDVHQGLLIPSYVEWRPGHWEWFFARFVWPRRWAKRTTGRLIEPRNYSVRTRE